MLPPRDITDLVQSIPLAHVVARLGSISQGFFDPLPASWLAILLDTVARSSSSGIYFRPGYCFPFLLSSFFLSSSSSSCSSPSLFFSSAESNRLVNSGTACLRADLARAGSIQPSSQDAPSVSTHTRTRTVKEEKHFQFGCSAYPMAPHVKFFFSLSRLGL